MIKKPCVLVIDDVALDRAVLGRLLDSASVTYRQAATAEEALLAMDAEPKLTHLLVDWNLPGLSGLELVRMVRRKRSHDDLKIVMVTGETDMVQILRAIEGGVDEYLMKPVTRETFREKLGLVGIDIKYATQAPVRKALVVDDSSTVRTLVSRILAQAGFESVPAANGQEALLQAEKHPDLVLAMVDWNMPVMNGLELVKRLRETKSHAAMKIIMVTTETEMHQVTRALEAGIDEYVMKPFTPDVVLEKLEMVGMKVREVPPK